MNLKKLLGKNDEQLLTAKQYRISTALRIRSGQSLTILAPLAALGAMTNDPLLMIPALYIVVAQGLGFQLLKAPLVKLAGSKRFWPVLGILAGGFAANALIPMSWFVTPNPYAPDLTPRASVLRTAAEYQHILLIVGLLLAIGFAGLSYLWMKGSHTRSMQRIALHLAQQESINA